VTLTDTIGDVADGKYDEQAKLADEKLGVSSLAAHGAAHIAPFMPQQMQNMRTGMHHAASRLVIVLRMLAFLPASSLSVNRVLRPLLLPQCFQMRR
jgi:hypothetical protein